MAGFQLLIYLHLHIIELHLNAIKKGIVIGRTRRNLIQSIDLSIMPSKIRFGSTRLRSPGVAFKVGVINASSILAGVERRPRIRSPKR